MLRIPLHSSRFLTIGLFVAHFAAAACVLIVPISIWLQLFLCAMLVTSLGLYLAREAWRIRASSIVELQCDREGGAWIQTRRGETREARVLGSSFVAPYLTIILLKPNANWRVRTLLILPDAVEAELFRQLRVWLKWRVGSGVEAEPSAGWAGRV